MKSEKQAMLDSVQRTLIDTLYNLVDFINTCKFDDLRKGAIDTAMEVEDNLLEYFNITVNGYTKTAKSRQYLYIKTESFWKERIFKWIV